MGWTQEDLHPIGGFLEIHRRSNNENLDLQLFFPMLTGEASTSNCTKTSYRVWKGRVLLPNDLNKKEPKDVMIKGYFQNNPNGTYLLSLGALKQHSGLRWCSGTYPTWHPRRSDPIRKLNGKLEGSGKGWSTWHRINCETGKILPFPTITVGVVCYTQKNGRLFVGNGDVLEKISLEDPPENHSWIPFQGTKSASRESKQCYTRRS